MPLGIFTDKSLPSKVLNLASPPNNKSNTEHSKVITKLFPSRFHNGCSTTLLFTFRSPDGKYVLLSSPRSRKRIFTPCATPAGISISASLTLPLCILYLVANKQSLTESGWIEKSAQPSKNTSRREPVATV